MSIQTWKLTFTRANPLTWGRAILGGLPFLLYPLVAYEIFYLPGLERYRRPFQCAFYDCRRPVMSDGGIALYQPWFGLFYLFILGMLVVAWRKGWPRWSSPILGFALLGMVELGIYFFPSGLIGGFVVIAILLSYICMLVILARRDPLGAVLAGLPLFPMFMWLLSLDGVKGMDYEVVTFYLAGLVMFLAVLAALRLGRLDQGLLSLMSGIVLVGIFVSYGTTYLSNMPVPPPPSLAKLLGAILGSALLMLLYTLPVWASLAWQNRKR